MIENDGGFTPQELAESRRMWKVVTYLTSFRHQQSDSAPNAYGYDDSSALVQQVARVLQEFARLKDEQPEVKKLRDLQKLMRLIGEHEVEKDCERDELARELTRMMRLMKAEDVEKDYIWKELASRMKNWTQDAKK